MTAEYKATKNMDASNTYAVLTIMSAIMLAFPAMFAEGMSAKNSFDDVNDKATLLKARRRYIAPTRSCPASFASRQSANVLYTTLTQPPQA